MLSRTLLSAALPATESEDSRYMLNGVQIKHTADTVVAESTNGHMAVTVTEARQPDTEFPWSVVELDPLTCPDPVVLPAELVTQALKTAPKTTSLYPALKHVVLGQRGDTVHIAATDLASKMTAVVTPTDKPFPDFNKIYPAEDPNADLTVRLTVRMLENMVKVAKGIVGTGKEATRNGVVKLTIPASSRREGGCHLSFPILMEVAQDGVKAKCVIMPCRP